MLASMHEQTQVVELDFHIIKALIRVRKKLGLTQKDLSERTGIAQSDISKLENGGVNPSLKTLQRLASGMDLQLKFELIPLK